MASLAQMLLGNSALTQPDAPVVTPTPTFQPEDAVARQYKLADALRNVPAAHSWAGVLANGLGAVGGNLIQGDANNALASNQALRKTDIQNAANATDLPSLEKSLIGAQTPDIQTLGLNAKIKTLSDDPNKDYRVRAAQAVQYGLKPGTAEFNRFVLTNKMSDPNESGAFGKAGTIVQGSDGSFYSIQFGSGGQRKIEKLELGAPPATSSPQPGEDAAPTAPPVALTPSRGVAVEGDLMYDKATGAPIKSVGSNIAEGERQKIIGRETGQGQMNLPKQKNALAMSKIQDDIVIGDIDKAIANSDAYTVGLWGSAVSSLPGTAAHDLQKTLTTIKANLGFDKLQDMRTNSPTGGALGNVSNMEVETLQSVMGNLSNSQTPAQLKYNLERLKETRKQFAKMRQEAYEADVARFGAANVPNPETGELPGQQQAPAAPAASPQSRPRAVNPQTGQTLEFDGQNWIEVR